MSRVDALKRIAITISATREAVVGGTGYLDGPVEPTARAMRGVDKYGRTFVTLCVSYCGKDDHAFYNSGGVLTVFQRYTDSDIVTQANNSSCPPLLFLSGAATSDEMRMLEELVTTGKANCVVDGVMGGTLHAQYELVEPAVALSWKHYSARFVEGIH